MIIRFDSPLPQAIIGYLGESIEPGFAGPCFCCREPVETGGAAGPYVLWYGWGVERPEAPTTLVFHAPCADRFAAAFLRDVHELG